MKSSTLARMGARDRARSNFKLKRAVHYQSPKPQGPFRDAMQVQPLAVLELPPRSTAYQNTARLQLGQHEPVLILKVLGLGVPQGYGVGEQPGWHRPGDMVG